jgi:protein involved in polysaccharide export with SLBB domain
MTTGRRLLVRRLRAAVLAAAVLCSGCLSAHKKHDGPPAPPDKLIVPSEVYTLACPDVIEVIFTDRPDLGQIVRVNPDGCVRLVHVGPVPVEGLTVADAAAQIAERVELPPHKVLVQVVEYGSRQVFLFGQVHGGTRIVDYHGPETVVDLLRRTGGLSPDAAPEEIYVVRALLGEGIPAEVLTVDLDAILRKNDQRTNIRVQPLDEIYVGEKPRSRIERAVPTFLKPLYESVVELIPRRDRASAEEPKPAK